MPHTLVETSTFDASVNVPSPGDNRNAASVETPFQALADRTRYAYDHLNAIEAAIVGVDSTKTFALPFGQPIVNTNARWSLSAAGIWTQVSVADAGLIVIPLVMPAIVGRILEARLALKGSAGHGALPATKPSFTLTKVNPETGNGATTLVASTSDASASTGAYEAVHVISHPYATGTGPQLDGTQTLAIAFTGEASTNSQTGLEIYGLRLVIEP